MIIDEIDGQRGYLKILLHLKEKKFTNVRELYGQIGISHSGAYSALSKLLSHGLVEEKEEWGKDRRGGKRKNYYLTDKGKKIADKLRDIEKIIED